MIFLLKKSEVRIWRVSELQEKKWDLGLILDQIDAIEKYLWQLCEVTLLYDN